MLSRTAETTRQRGSNARTNHDAEAYRCEKIAWTPHDAAKGNGTAIPVTRNPLIRRAADRKFFENPQLTNVSFNNSESRVASCRSTTSSKFGVPDYLLALSKLRLGSADVVEMRRRSQAEAECSNESLNSENSTESCLEAVAERTRSSGKAPAPRKKPRSKVDDAPKRTIAKNTWKTPVMNAALKRAFAKAVASLTVADQMSLGARNPFGYGRVAPARRGKNKNAPNNRRANAGKNITKRGRKPKANTKNGGKSPKCGKTNMRNTSKKAENQARYDDTDEDDETVQNDDDDEQSYVPTPRKGKPKSSESRKREVEKFKKELKQKGCSKKLKTEKQPRSFKPRGKSTQPKITKERLPKTCTECKQPLNGLAGNMSRGMEVVYMNFEDDVGNDETNYDRLFLQPYGPKSHQKDFIGEDEDDGECSDCEREGDAEGEEEEDAVDDPQHSRGNEEESDASSCDECEKERKPGRSILKKGRNRKMAKRNGDGNDSDADSEEKMNVAHPSGVGSDSTLAHAWTLSNTTFQSTASW